MPRLAKIATVCLPLIALAGTPAWSGETEAPTNAFITLPEIRTAIVDSGSVEGVITVKLAIKPAKPDGSEGLVARLPSIRTTALSAVLEFARLRASAYRPVNSELLRAQVSNALRKADPGIGQVLVLELGAYPT